MYVAHAQGERNKAVIKIRVDTNKHKPGNRFDAVIQYIARLLHQPAVPPCLLKQQHCNLYALAVLSFPVHAINLQRSMQCYWMHVPNQIACLQCNSQCVLHCPCTYSRQMTLAGKCKPHAPTARLVWHACAHNRSIDMAWYMTHQAKSLLPIGVATEVGV